MEVTDGMSCEDVDPDEPEGDERVCVVDVELAMYEDEGVVTITFDPKIPGLRDRIHEVMKKIADTLLYRLDGQRLSDN